MPPVNPFQLELSRTNPILAAFFAHDQQKRIDAETQLQTDQILSQAERANQQLDLNKRRVDLESQRLSNALEQQKLENELQGLLVEPTLTEQARKGNLSLKGQELPGFQPIPDELSGGIPGGSPQFDTQVNERSFQNPFTGEDFSISQEQIEGQDLREVELLAQTEGIKQQRTINQELFKAGIQNQRDALQHDRALEKQEVDLTFKANEGRLNRASRENAAKLRGSSAVGKSQLSTNYVLQYGSGLLDSGRLSAAKGGENIVIGNALAESGWVMPFPKFNETVRGLKDLEPLVKTYRDLISFQRKNGIDSGTKAKIKTFQSKIQQQFGKSGSELAQAQQTALGTLGQLVQSIGGETSSRISDQDVERMKGLAANPNFGWRANQAREILLSQFIEASVNHVLAIFPPDQRKAMIRDHRLESIATPRGLDPNETEAIMQGMRNKIDRLLSQGGE